MKVSVFDEMSLCTDEEVDRMASLVPKWRYIQAMKFKHTFGSFACLKSYLMLQEILGVDISEMKFDYLSKGKPYFADYPNIHFNISHCRNGIAVCVDDKPIGIDIENFHQVNDNLIKKTMNCQEISEINASINPEVIFTSFWTKKEAVLKLRATGLIDDLPTVLSGKETIQTKINYKMEYVYSIAFNEL